VGYAGYLRLGVTEDGWMGLMPAMTREGDVVCVLRGCEVPLILRDNGGGSRWSSVGEAYVHGIMDGEEWGGVGLLGKRWNLKFVTVLASWKRGVR
jgi:hypothetical protein